MEIIIAIVPKIAAFLTSILCFLSSIFSPLTSRIDTMKSVTEIDDNLYIMDYGYDYDALDMLENGIDNIVDLLLKGLSTIYIGGDGFACTTFNSVTAEGDYLMSRNFDYMDSPALLVRTTPEDGYASISTVSLYFVGYELDSDFKPDNTDDNIITLLAPYLPLDGINEKGLAIGVLELETAPTFQMTLKPNLTTTTMIRACLDNAATVEEAIEIFKSHDMRDMLFDECKYHFQISDAEGNSAIIEYYDNEMYVICPEQSDTNAVDYQAATNFHLIDGVDDPDGMGWDRYDLVMAELKKSGGITSEEKAMAILDSVHMKDADLHGYICSTLWSNVFNLTDKTVTMCSFGNYEKSLTFSVSEPLNEQITSE